MHNVIVFMLYVRPLNQMINPFNLATGFSLGSRPRPLANGVTASPQVGAHAPDALLEVLGVQGWNCAAFIECLFAHLCCKKPILGRRVDWRTLLFIYLFIIALRYLYCVISVATKCHLIPI